MVARLSYEFSSQYASGTFVDARDMQGTIKELGAYETFRGVQKMTLQECNAMLEEYMERVRIRRY